MKKLVTVLLLLTSCNLASAQQTAGTTALDPTQVYSTGNIVQPTTAGTGTTPWVNGVYQDQLTCWAWGNPGNCGPNPTVRPDNQINFSFGYSDLYQIQSVASVLPTTGLRVNGYNFGFMAKNGNGWDDGRVDQLNAYVTFYGTDGKVKDYTNYDLNSKFNWTQFDYSKTFVTPYADKDLSSVRYGFTGADNNFWAGTYGPEIYNVSFSLKYSVDPCATNPLYSPTCPGYLEALNRLLPPVTVVDGTTTSVLSSVDRELSPPPPPPGSPPPPPGSPPPPPGSPPPPPGSPNSSLTSNTSFGTVSTTKESSPDSGRNVSLALNIINKNSERDATASTVAQSAETQAQTVATQAQRESQNIAANAVVNSVSVNAVSISAQQSLGTGIRSTVNTASAQQSLGTGIRSTVNTANSTNFLLQLGQTVLSTAVQATQTTNDTASQQQNSAGIAAVIFNNQITAATSASTQQLATDVTTVVLPLLPPNIANTANTAIASVAVGGVEQSQSTPVQSMIQNTSTTPVVESYALVPANILTDRTSPLSAIIEERQTLSANTSTFQSSFSVNKNAANNDAAVGVNLTQLALAPVGYGDYLNATLRDAAFYAPREVYRNQVNVDNARALRGLGSDRLHLEMVNQQYRR